ncbi:MAG: esterase-like activity of phytase family protein [Candidatus Parabeggiatoa sp.]|nr:esterase-like activity of phytase family protein [Candidatus Parabeggiatoa sp.]
MNLRLFYILLLGILIVNLTACDDDDVISMVTSGEEIITLDVPMESVSFQGGKTLALQIGLGSGAFHYRDDPTDEIYTITDRGPTIDCDKSEELIGKANFCMNNGAVDEDGKIFPVANFTPTIYKLNIDTGGLIGAKVGYEVTQTIEIKDSDGKKISGLPNPLQVTNTENAYDNKGDKKAFDPNGLDPEAIIRLFNGSFWIAEEYAPSLVHLTADGRIMERLVPSGVENDLTEANYLVRGILPAILKKRQLDRGIEALAISPDEQFLYFIMAGPLANPDQAAYEKSRYVRLFKLSLQEDIPKVMGEYVYMLDTHDTFWDNTTKQSDVKISEMVALDTDKLIILEHVHRHTKLYRVSILDSGSNIVDQQWDEESRSPSLETVQNLEEHGIELLDKKRVFDSSKEQTDLAVGIEGIAILDDEYLAFINDNDFGIDRSIDDSKTRIKVAKIVKQLSE